MGTRNLTIVKIDGEYKIAQYGQWDGYPSGQGVICLNFLKKRMVPETFKKAVRNCKYAAEEYISALWKEYGADEKGFISLKDSERLARDYPEFSRDTGAKILELVQAHPDGLQLQNQLPFAADGLFCEWAWVIDFDAGTFEGYKGWSKKPLADSERFAFLKEYEDGDYHGVRLAASFPLDALPDEETFLAAFKEDEDEGEGWTFI